MRFLLASLIFTLPALGFSQNHRSVAITDMGYGMVKTNINLNYEHSWGQIDDNFHARASIECINTKSFSLTANARYNS